ncbi:Uroporphyrinogen decarboxylase [Neomoorella glycerini]|uniref:Uroporphyrinogen decarboxylase n=1 Tax=Neomoorella glycerini TaxID=55779 RepID=A0A6I5ZU70_9FIRM|nr:uroporphyrinogen decarboxylase family protein [Moorella glycerini]QGP93238.1 Uroporphyrinogen decarboxylase [Moorella glycerini]
MTSKERALVAIKGNKTDRLPMWYGGAPETTQNIMDFLGAKTEKEALYDILGMDFKTIRPKYIGLPFKKYEDGTVENEWGIRRGGLHYGQALNHPLADAQTIKDVEKYKFPDPDDWDVVITREELEDARGYCLIGATWAPFFHDSTELMGMEQFFVNMYVNPGVVEAIIRKCFEFYYELNRRTYEANPDVIDFYFFGNDFGSMRALLMSPEMWRKFYKPYVAKLIEQAHANGAVAGLHSCGDIHEIFPDLIEIGLDVINPIQVSCQHMDPAVLKREYGKHIAFFGGIDENEILLNGTEAEVRAETRRIIDVLGSDGRYIVAASHDYLLPEVPARNIVAMYDEARKYSSGR